MSRFGRLTIVTRPYHHGDLRRALLDAALAQVAEHGPAALSLREVARQAGVSHAAPAHHFGNKAGLLTAIATEGYRILASALAEAGDFREQGVAYVVFATEHPAHFAVMRAPDLLHNDTPELTAARDDAGRHLGDSVAARMHPADPVAFRAAPIAAWALVHGLASLLLEGNVQPGPDEDVASLARAVTGHLRAE
jgi:AcrR family transcriptional regulator